ncbi:MAG: hypothetical protein WC708_06825 [Lentisphaeria bacterium]
MDWPTVRVLTNNLRELFDQMQAGDHIPKGKEGDSVLESKGTVTEIWRIGMLTVTPSLLSELGLKNDERNIHHSWQSFSWPESEEFKRNPYIRTAEATLGVAEKLLRDYDTEIQKTIKSKAEPTLQTR